MKRLTESAARRDLAGEPLVNVIVGEPVEDALAAALAALVERYGSRRVNRALRAALAKPTAGRPRKVPLEPRERRLLMLYDTEPRRPDGRPNNKAFVAHWYAQGEIEANSLKAAEEQFKRLLRARKNQGA